MDTHYVSVGANDAPALVLVHGFPFSHEQWAPQLGSPIASHRSIAYDLRGHGATPRGPMPYLMDHLVDDLIALLDHLEIERATLCGLSMGGYVALHAAIREPGRVEGLVLCDTSATGDSNEGRTKRAAGIRKLADEGVSAFCDGLDAAVFAPRSLRAPSPALTRLREVMRASNPAAMAFALAAMAARHDHREGLAAIEIPTQVIVGSEDKLTPLSAAQILRDGIPGAKLDVIPDAGHVSNIEQPEAFNRVLASFLSR